MSHVADFRWYKFEVVNSQQAYLPAQNGVKAKGKSIIPALLLDKCWDYMIEFHLHM